MMTAKEKILGMLMGDPERLFFARDFSRELGYTPLYIRTVLNSMAADGIITKIRNRKTWEQLKKDGMKYPGNIKYLWKFRKSCYSCKNCKKFGSSYICARDGEIIDELGRTCERYDRKEVVEELT